MCPHRPTDRVGSDLSQRLEQVQLAAKKPQSDLMSTVEPKLMEFR